MKTAATMVLGLISLAVLVCLALYYLLGVWPPDMLTRRATVLCSAESPTGGRFLVVQYWGHDFYTTQLEELAPDGMMRVRVIDGDDKKQKQCQVQILEDDEALVVSLADGSPPIRYQWNEKKFVMPAGRGRLRD